MLKAGAGSGSVGSTPNGIVCGATCSHPFDPGRPVTLTATPAAGSVFAGWSGSGCTGTGTCRLALHQAGAVTATFSAAAKPSSPSFGKAVPGRRVGKSCRKPSRSNRSKRKCTRYKAASGFSVNGKAGANKVAFASKLSRSKRLSLGKYKLTATPTNAAGKGAARTTKFNLVRR